MVLLSLITIDPPPRFFAKTVIDNAIDTIIKVTADNMQIIIFLFFIFLISTLQIIAYVKRFSERPIVSGSVRLFFNVAETEFLYVVIKFQFELYVIIVTVP